MTTNFLNSYRCLSLKPMIKVVWLLQKHPYHLKMIQKPYLIADIPHNLSGLPGNILATDVLAVAGYKKRKRSELALAIDGQGINIYDVSLMIHVI